jgi:hypothetical protein
LSKLWPSTNERVAGLRLRFFRQQGGIMRIITTAFLLLASPAAAEGWEVMFLTDGGSRPMQVGPNEGGSPLAYVENRKGERLFLECRSTKAGVDEWTLRFYPGPEPTVLPGESKGTRFVVSFDDEATDYHLGPFTYVQEAFWAVVPEDIAYGIIANAVVHVEIPGAYVRGSESYSTEFSLSGSEAAIDRSCPLR